MQLQGRVCANFISRMCWLHWWLCNAWRTLFLFLHPDGQGASVSCVGKYLVVIWNWGEGNQQATFVGVNSTFHPLLVVEHIILPLFICTLIWGLDCCISSSLHPLKHAMIIHSNYFDRGLAAINTGNSGHPWTRWSENTSCDIERTKGWVEQRTLWKSSFSPIHLFIWLLRLRTRRTPWFLTPTDFLPPSPSSSSLNHALSMHSVHFLPNLELEKSRIVEIWRASQSPLCTVEWFRSCRHSCSPNLRKQPQFNGRDDSSYTTYLKSA